MSSSSTLIVTNLHTTSVRSARRQQRMPWRNGKKTLHTWPAMPFFQGAAEGGLYRCSRVRPWMERFFPTVLMN
jgi:hypothetical protein